MGEVVALVQQGLAGGLSEGVGEAVRLERRPSSVNGTEIGPKSALPDEPARFRQDATLSVLHVDGAEPYRAGVVEEPAAVRLKHREAGPLKCRVKCECLRAA